MNGYATDLEAFPDGKTAVFLKWRSDWRGFSITNRICSTFRVAQAYNRYQKCGERAANKLFVTGYR